VTAYTLSLAATFLFNSATFQCVFQRENCSFSAFTPFFRLHDVKRSNLGVAWRRYDARRQKNKRQPVLPSVLHAASSPEHRVAVSLRRGATLWRHRYRIAAPAGQRSSSQRTAAPRAPAPHKQHSPRSTRLDGDDGRKRRRRAPRADKCATAAALTDQSARASRHQQ